MDKIQQVLTLQSDQQACKGMSSIKIHSIGHFTILFFVFPLYMEYMKIYTWKTSVLVSLKLAFVKDWRIISITEQYCYMKGHRLMDLLRLYQPSSNSVAPCGLSYTFKSFFLKLRIPETTDAKSGTRSLELHLSLPRFFSLVN